MTKTMRTIWVAGALIAAGMATPAGHAQPSHSEARTVEGVWFVAVTPRNCATGAQVAPPIDSMVTFHPGGTLSEAPAALAFAPGQRLNGMGTWRHHGGHNYQQRFAALIAFTTPPAPPAPGFEAGWQEVEQTVELIDADTLRSSGTNAFYRKDGSLYRTGCSTATLRRFQ